MSTIITHDDPVIGACEICGGVRRKISSTHAGYCAHIQDLEVKVEALEARVRALELPRIFTTPPEGATK